MSATSDATSTGSFSTTYANLDCCEVICLAWKMVSSWTNHVCTLVLYVGSSILNVALVGAVESAILTWFLFGGKKKFEIGAF